MADSSLIECELPFWKDWSNLIKPPQYIPACEYSLLIFITKIIILFGIVAIIAYYIQGLHACLFMILSGIILIGLTVYFTPVSTKQYSKSSGVSDTSDLSNTSTYTQKIVPIQKTEHFTNGGNTTGSIQPYTESSGIWSSTLGQYDYESSMESNYTKPTARNPFMNVLPDEIKYNPNRPSAGPVTDSTIKQTMDDFFRVQWFSDPTDVFGKNQNQRQFVTQPSTTVPNDRGSFADWLYKIPGKTCKEGGREACYSGSNSGSIPWLN
jgi:hypothetical protein